LNGFAIEGGETIGYEMIGRLAREGGAHRTAGANVALDAVVVQVGGGALASAVAAAFAEARILGAIDREPRLYAVQAEGCAPLARAWDRFEERAAVGGVEEALEHARRHRSRYMRPWGAEPASAAHGILDDETYDWLAVVEAAARTGGGVAVVDETTILAANDLGRASTGIDVDHTGTAGLAGLLALLRNGDVRPDETVAVLFTGVRRHEDRHGAAVEATVAPMRPRESSAR
jgi:threonine synthase